MDLTYKVSMAWCADDHLVAIDRNSRAKKISRPSHRRSWVVKRLQQFSAGFVEEIGLSDSLALDALYKPTKKKRKGDSVVSV